jgi:alkaline phosphatase D
MSENPIKPTRRQVLLAGTAAIGAATVGGTGLAQATGAGRGVIRAPFQLGVASGDPLPDGVVLWTRLAPEPLTEDGFGGMPDRIVPVQWQVATDEKFTDVVAEGTEQTARESAHSVHVEVSGLRPGADYFYRFRVDGEISPAGRTRTAPAPGSRLDRFAFAFASCQHYAAGYYTAYQHMAEEDLDLVAFLGDYIYESGATGSLGRAHVPAREITDLADYRTRLGQYKADEHLQAAHAAFPWAVVFDDHEVENNWAGDISQPDTEPDQDPEVFRRRRAQAFQAYWEHMPLRRAQRPDGPDIRIHRQLTFGDLVDLHLLDTRQYRDDQEVPPDQVQDPNRTMLGGQQREWLFGNLAGSTARWNVLAQQVFFSKRDFAAGDAESVSDDAWDNYPVERGLVRDRLGAVSNPVVITGDVHANYAAEIKADFDEPASKTVGVELVGTSIASGGDGREQNPGDSVQLDENPHIKFVNRKRGYVRNTITPGEWTADYRVLEYVTEPGSPIATRKTYTIQEGEPGLTD